MSLLVENIDSGTDDSATVPSFSFAYFLSDVKMIDNLPTIEIASDQIGNDDKSKKTPMQEIEAAYRACSFGWFHVKLICVSFLGSVAGVLVSNTMSYLLPAAECDLHMDLVQKGMLNAAPFIGMSVTSLIAGFLTDNFGRKLFLKVGFGGIFVFCVVGGSSQTFEVLVSAKFLEGMFFATSISAHVTFLSEFCHKGIRDQMLLCQAAFIAIAQIVSPAMALGILTQDWTVSLFNGYLVLHTWNFYLYAMSLWSLLACILYSTLPESPKYLVGKKKYDEAREILIKMYKENTGNPVENYPYINIWKDIPNQTPSQKEESKGFKHQIVIGLRNAKPLFHKPLAIYLVMLGTVSFLLMAIYNIVRLWFPQLSTIVEHYEINADNDLCVMLDKYTSDLKIKNNATTSGVCVPNKAGIETYINSMIVGFICLLPYFVTGFFVNKVGKKIMQVTVSLIGVGVTLGLRWANSKLAMVALFAVDTAILQLMKSLNQAMAVELFSTSLRSFALACTMMTGRLGTLSGNIGFPILLDMGCVVPFFTMAGMLAVITIISMLVPKKTQPH